MAGERAVKGAVNGLDDVQAGAVSLAAAHGVSLLTGGPGTGKSRTVAAIVAVLTALDSGAPPPPEPRPEWNAPHRHQRRTHPHGPGGWRASSLPY